MVHEILRHYTYAMLLSRYSSKAALSAAQYTARLSDGAAAASFHFISYRCHLVNECLTTKALLKSSSTFVIKRATTVSKNHRRFLRIHTAGQLAGGSRHLNSSLMTTQNSCFSQNIFDNKNSLFLDLENSCSR